MSARQCVYMATAYPTLTVEDTCADHRHEPRVFALARAMAQAFQGNTADETVAWFVDDADAVVDDFGGPEWGPWVVTSRDLPADLRGIDHLFTINGIEYVIQASDYEPSTPVRRSEWESWLNEDR